MQFSFLHCSDIHLGYQQYGVRERFNDFGRAFLHVVDDAVRRQVRFVLLGGDLFHRRSVEPLALVQAVVGLEKLRAANIPVLAVEGNHERPHYKEEFGWMDFLDRQGYLKLLNPTFDTDGKIELKPYNDDGGAFADLDGVRIYGVKYYGAATSRVLDQMVQGLPQISPDGIEYTVMLLHNGLDGIMPHVSGGVTHENIAPLQRHVNYLALGHLHKPYQRDEWIYNPGSLETVSIDEVQWQDRGYYFVEVDTARSPKHRVKLIANPRRSFVRLGVDVSGLTTPKRLYDAVEREAKRAVRQVDEKPIVEIDLHGTLAFDAGALDLDFVREIVETAYSPLHVLFKNNTASTAFEIRAGEVTESRAELERRVLKELFERDARYRPGSEQWADVAAQVKRMAIEDSAPKNIVTYLQKQQAKLAPQEP